MDAIDSSKENIQPLRHGRKTHLLGLALQAQTDTDVHHQLLKERDEYELQIRIYEGNDPLKPRYDYVLWLEQCYPKHGRDANLIPLLEDTITMYKDDERYQQDPRFVELIIKFIETQVNPLELYQVVYNLGIGTACALLYKSWAEELDRNGDLKRADQIFQLGLSNFAHPLESLRLEHEQFQYSVGRRLLNGEELQPKPENPITDENKRQVLGKLKTKVGSSRPTFGKAGIVPLCLSNRNIPKASKSNAPISIYLDDDENDNPVNTVENYQTKKLPKSDLAKKENSLKPSTWNKPHKTKSYQPVYTPTTPRFKVHEDAEPSAPQTPMSVCPSALKTRKAEAFHCPVAIFEPHDPSVKPMYCKSKIYVGGREFQFEEIQAAMYYKNMREKRAKEEMDKLGLKMESNMCFETPMAIRKVASAISKSTASKINKPLTPFFESNIKEPLTPLMNDIQPLTPHASKNRNQMQVYCDNDEPVTPCAATEPKTPVPSGSRVEPVTPFQCTSHFQPFTPYDLPSKHFNDTVMEGAETTKKIQPSSLKETNEKSKLSESTTHVKKFLNFSVYQDED